MSLRLAADNLPGAMEREASLVDDRTKSTEQNLAKMTIFHYLRGRYLKSGSQELLKAPVQLHVSDIPQPFSPKRRCSF